MSAARTHHVEIDARSLTDWDAFHAVFAQKLGFPSYYGRNMNAWYDCLSSLPDESTVLVLADGDTLQIDLKDFCVLEGRQPELAEAIIVGVENANRRLIEARALRASGGVQCPLLGSVALSLSE